MRSLALFAGLSVLASAQLLSPEELANIPAAPTKVVPLAAGQTSETKSYNAAAASASAFADTLDDPKGPTARRTVKKLRERAACDPQPAGYGPVPSPDTADAFLSDSDFSGAANGAQTPSGWVQTYQNLQAATSTSGYMGYKTYSSYSPAQCAADCSAINGCLAFNIFFERDPSVEPADACPDPPSTTVIKCSFWGNTVEAPTATNQGQYRDNFHVVIAGSNGYQMIQPTFNEPGYTGTFLGDKTINSPSECNSYLTVKTFSDGSPYDPARCAAACAAETSWAISSGSGNTCQFFTSYLLEKNGVSQSQICALYRTTWDASYATNDGYYYGSDHYTIAYSYSYSNTTTPSTYQCPHSSS